MKIKLVKNIAGFIVIGCLVSDDFARSIDRNLARPIRNYRVTLSDYDHFRTPEDMGRFWRELGNGLLNFLRPNEKYD